MASEESAWFQGIVAKLAYKLWEERGRPLGSPEQDWIRAEQVVRHHLGPSAEHEVAFPPLLESLPSQTMADDLSQRRIARQREHQKGDSP